jgi:hypothetical protein
MNAEVQRVQSLLIVIAGGGVVDYLGLRAIVFDDRRLSGLFGVTLALALAVAVALVAVAPLMVGGEDSGGQAGLAITMTGETGELEEDPLLPSPPVRHDLVLRSTVGGNVTEPGEGSFEYNEGSVVDLVAEPAEGFRFLEWTGDVSTVADVNSGITSIIMDGDYDIMAGFDPVPDSSAFPWWWILIGLVIAGLLAYFLWWRRRARTVDFSGQE